MGEMQKAKASPAGPPNSEPRRLISASDLELEMMLAPATPMTVSHTTKKATVARTEYFVDI
jgi:hypothetical protein